MDGEKKMPFTRPHFRCGVTQRRCEEHRRYSVFDDDDDDDDDDDGWRCESYQSIQNLMVSSNFEIAIRSLCLWVKDFIGTNNTLRLTGFIGKSKNILRDSVIGAIL